MGTMPGILTTARLTTRLLSRTRVTAFQHVKAASFFCGNFEIGTGAVPEAASLLLILIGTGLAGIGLAAWRTRK